MFLALCSSLFDWDSITYKGTDVFLGREVTLMGFAVVIQAASIAADGYRTSIGVWCRAFPDT